MRKITLLVLFLVVCIHLLEAKDLVLGSRVNNLLISTEKVVYNKIPLIRRDKDYTYTDPKNRIIKVEYIFYKLLFTSIVLSTNYYIIEYGCTDWVVSKIESSRKFSWNFKLWNKEFGGDSLINNFQHCVGIGTFEA